MKKQVVVCTNAMMSCLVVQLHLIIFGPGRGETDPMREVRKTLKKNFNDPKFSGINILNEPDFSNNKNIQFTVEVVGWPDGSWIRAKFEKVDNEEISLWPFMWRSELVWINIPNLFDEQLLVWMPVPPFFRAVSDGDQSQPELLTKLINSVELSNYL